MLPSYTSLIKKLRHFQKVLTVTIFYCYINQRRHRERHRWHREKHQEERYLRFVTFCVTEMKYLDFQLFKALITIGSLFSWILQFRQFLLEKWKAKQLYRTLQKCNSRHGRDMNLLLSDSSGTRGVGTLLGTQGVQSERVLSKCTFMTM